MAGANTIQGLGDLPGGAYRSFADGISFDGGTIVGRSSSILSGAFNEEAFRWQAGTMTGLGFLPGGSHFSEAGATSSDGSVVVGIADSATSVQTAFRWTQTGGMIAIPGLQPKAIIGVSGVSGDGSILVGGSASPQGPQAFYWTQASGSVGLGDLKHGSTVNSGASAISKDGQVIVGGAASPNGGGAFRWTQAGGMVGLGNLPGGNASSANAVNQDGSVIVGSAFSGRGEEEAFRWTQTGGVVGLDFLYYDPSQMNYSRANAVSPDGNWVVGTSNNTAFLWDASGGLRDLNSLLSSADHANWILTSATGITEVNNTLYVVGNGAFKYDQTTGLFRDEAWLMQLPLPVAEPSGGGAMLIGLAGLGVMALRRR